MDLTLVVLAAGVGSRYGGLKQLDTVGPNGEALLEYSVYDALRAGFSRVVFVVRSETEDQFRQAFAGGMAGQVSLAYVHQSLTDLPVGYQSPPTRSKPWGTGQAILATAIEVEGPFAVINADDFYGAGSFRTLADFLRQDRHAGSPNFAMVGFAVGQTLSDAGPVSRGLCRLDDGGRLESILEIPKLWRHGSGGLYRDEQGNEVEVSGDRLVSMNMWGFTEALFPELEREFRIFLDRYGRSDKAEFFVPEAIQTLIREGRARVDVLPHTGQWCGMTYPEDRERTAAILAARVAAGDYPQNLWK